MKKIHNLFFILLIPFHATAFFNPKDPSTLQLHNLAIKNVPYKNFYYQFGPIYLKPETYTPQDLWALLGGSITGFGELKRFINTQTGTVNFTPTQAIAPEIILTPETNPGPQLRITAKLGELKFESILNLTTLAAFVVEKVGSLYETNRLAQDNVEVTMALVIDPADERVVYLDSLWASGIGTITHDQLIAGYKGSPMLLEGLFS